MSDAYERKLNSKMDPDFPTFINNLDGKLGNPKGDGKLFQPRVQAREFYRKKNLEFQSFFFL